MNNVFIIMKKELKRFFTDKRLLATLVLPGILIFAIYSFMGSVMNDLFYPSEDYEYKISSLNAPAQLEEILKASKLKYILTAAEDATEQKELVKQKSIDIFVEYEENFANKLSSGEKPFVKIWYNTTNTQSQTVYNAVYGALYASSVEVKTVFYLNAGEETYDLATKEDASAMVMTMMLPFLLIMLLFSGCMAVTTESIAGEKERGTIATLLVTPVKREYIALGKILALSITALASSTITFIGLVASLPKLMGAGAEEISVNIYGAGTYIGALGVIAATVLLFTVLLAIISALSKSVKEASQLALPAMLAVIALGITSMLGGGNGASNSFWAYLIPVYNSVQCLSGLFARNFNGLFFAATIISDLAATAIGVFALAKIFGSEKIMFN